MKLYYVLLFIFCMALASAEIVIINETEKDFYSVEEVRVSGDLRDKSGP